MKKFAWVLLAICALGIFAVGCSGDETGLLDLTAMSETLRSAEMTRITSNPERYMGRPIKVRGAYDAMFFDEAEKYLHVVIITEGDGCCPPEGFEFRWGEDNVFPDGMPNSGSTIEMVGVLGRHNDLGSTLYYLAVDDVAVLD